MIGLFNKNSKNSIGRRVSAVMAGVMAITAITSYTYFNRREVAAKDTLDSIQKVVKGITSNDPYTILEIVPSDVPYSVSADSIVSVNALDGKSYIVSGNQAMGFMGYYIGGYEPFREDIRKTFNDTLSENTSLFDEQKEVYFRSSLSDSNMRYELADRMFDKLAEEGILKSRTSNYRSILSATTYERNDKTHYDVYKEVHEGDRVFDSQNDKYVEIDDFNYAEMGYEKLVKVYDEFENDKKPHYEDHSRYIDRSKGYMVPARGDYGNYVLNYDFEASLSDNDISLGFMNACKDAGLSLSQNAMISSNYIYMPVDGEQEWNIEGRLTDEYDDYEGLKTGAFEPNLKYDMSGDANITAVFRAIGGDASYGYIVNGATEITSSNIDDFGSRNTPVYRYENGRYVYAGRLSDVYDSLDTASTDATANGSVHAYAEPHLNTVFLSLPEYNETLKPSGQDVLIDKSNEEELLMETSELNNDGIDSEDHPEDGLSSEDILIEDVNTDENSQTLSSNTYDANETDSENSESSSDSSDGYYVVNFEYTTDSTHSKNGYYETAWFCYEDEDDDLGAQYILNSDSSYGTLVPNYYLTGCISPVINDDTRDYYIYDYRYGEGSYRWEPLPYTDENYYLPIDNMDEHETKKELLIPDLDNVCRIRGSKIYYKLDITNNEWLKQYAFDRDPGKACKELNVVIKRKTVSEASIDDVNNAKLISVMSGDAEFCLGNKFNDYTADENDLHFYVYKRIIERISIDNLPCVGDYRIVSGNTGVIKDSYTKKLINLLRLEDPSVFYRSISDLTPEYIAANPESDLDPLRSGSVVLESNDCHFVNKNVYVYNMKWAEQTGGSYQNFLNRFFYTMSEGDAAIKGFTETEVTEGFSEVYTDIENENLFRKTDGNQSLLNEEITEATALRYIIGYNERRVETKKGTMRILEIEPTAKFDLYVNDNGSGNGLGLIKRSNDTSVYGNGTYTTTTGQLYYKSQNNKIIDQEDTTIILTRMSVAEFVGHIEDLNAEYDMIYIGMNTDGLNTDKATQNDIENHRADKLNDTITVYNDHNMRGLVYTSIGDYLYMGQNLIGNKDEDYKSGSYNVGKLVDPTTTYYKDNIDKYRGRYNGNDISKKDVEALTEFVYAGYPVVLEDGFFKKNTSGAYNYNEISTERVDTMSYMYQFVNSVKDRSNVFARSNLTGKMFNWYLNLSKPEVTMYGLSNSALTNAQYLELSQVDNMYHAVFNFDIQNLGAADSNAKYYAKLYIDINADGKYSHTQEGISFTSMTTGEGSKIDKNIDGEYELSAGQSYIAQCQLSSSYIGVIPWRLEVTMKDNPWRRANKTGYYKVKKTNKTEINVLQIKSVKTVGATERNNWDMEAALNNNENNFRTYVEQTDFKLNIISKFPKDFLAMADPMEGGRTQDNYFKILEGYDMIILGFGDAYSWDDCLNNNNDKNAIDPAMKAIRDYINSGRSTLFTHDCTHYRNAEKDAYNTSYAPGHNYYSDFGHRFNKIIRNVVGMDRYNILNNDNMDEVQHNYDIPYKPRSGVRSNGELTISNNRLIISSNVSSDAEITNDNTGCTYYNLNYNTYLGGANVSVAKTAEYNIYYNTPNKYKDPNYYQNLKGIKKTGGKNTRGQKPVVTRVNNGQITTYPFVLDPFFEVVNTHGQYYQLDFTADDDLDGESDIVVWYCISNPDQNPTGGDEIYSISPNDVRNNYYIYNKGNVTYSGVGHSKVTGEQEIKLFINTLIAAYQKGVQEPMLRVVENYSDTARDINNIYLSFDKFYQEINAEDASKGDSRGVLDNNVDVYFTTEKTSLMQNSRFISHSLNGALYYEVADTYVNNSGDSSKDKVQLKDALGNIYYGVLVTPIEIERKTGEEDPESISDLNNLEDDVIYKVKVPLDSSVLPNIWYKAGDTSVKADDNKNLRRLLVVVTDSSYNSKTNRSSSLSNIKPLSMLRTQMFDLN